MNKIQIQFHHADNKSDEIGQRLFTKIEKFRDIINQDDSLTNNNSLLFNMLANLLKLTLFNFPEEMRQVLINNLIEVLKIELVCASCLKEETEREIKH